MLGLIRTASSLLIFALITHTAPGIVHSQQDVLDCTVSERDDPTPPSQEIRCRSSLILEKKPARPSYSYYVYSKGQVEAKTQLGYPIQLNFQATNLADAPIKAFDWKAAGIFSVILASPFIGSDGSLEETPASKSKDDITCIDYVSTKQSLIRAFGGEAEDWQLVVALPPRPEECTKPEAAVTSQFDVNRERPDVVWKFKEQNWLEDPVLAFRKPEEFGYFPEMRTTVRFSENQYLLESTTDAAYDLKSETIEVRRRVSITAQGAADVAISDPFLAALERYEQVAASVDDFYEMVRVFDTRREQLKIIEKTENIWVYEKTLVFPTLKESEHVLYYVNHPVTVEVDGERLCTDVGAFSPAPISGGAVFCVGE